MAIPKEVLTIQNTASIFPKADQAAAVSVPNVLRAAWMAIFVMANRTDSTAVGIPSLSCETRIDPVAHSFPCDPQRSPVSCQPDRDQNGTERLGNEGGNGSSGYSHIKGSHQ